MKKGDILSSADVPDAKIKVLKRAEVTLELETWKINRLSKLHRN
jgi:hypothetical protein